MKNLKTNKVPTIQIDFPKEKEVLTKGHYAVRVTAVGTGTVELLLGKDHWVPCRHDGEYYWFDWYPESKGRQKLKARIRPDLGKPKESSFRTCIIE